MKVLVIELLGGVQVSREGEPKLSFRNAKQLALLAYLASYPDEPQSRERLARYLWPQVPAGAAKDNFNSELSHFKKRLDKHPALYIERKCLRLNSQYCQIDTERLRHDLLAMRQAQSPAWWAEVHQRLLGYGPFMANFALKDAVDFEDWQLQRQSYWQQQWQLAMLALQAHWQRSGEWDKLQAAAEQMLGREPLHEQAALYQLEALLALEQCERAQRQFDEYCQRAQEELEAPLPASFVECADQLFAQYRQSAIKRHNVQVAGKSFVGRAQDLSKLQQVLQQHRLVTLQGIGGVGKSQLARRVALSLLDEFPDGVWFVPLANVHARGAAAVEQIASSIAAIIGYRITDGRAPLSELMQYLAEQRVLLVLDNWEHLASVAPYVLQQLLRQTRAHILATTRARLLPELEHTYVLRGLPLEDALRLFAARAASVDPSFELPDPQQSAAMCQICEQLAGLPLGIELVAARVAYGIERAVEHLMARAPGADSLAEASDTRHDTLYHVLAYSWHLLNARQQQVLARTSVFHASFDRQAAQQVARAELADLSALSGHSLLFSDAPGRYELHPLVKNFAKKQLLQLSCASLATDHSEHYFARLLDTEPSARVSRLATDFDNLRAAWNHSVAQGSWHRLMRCATSFGEFLRQTGRMVEGDQCFEAALKAQPEGQRVAHLYAQLLDQKWQFTRALRGIRCARNEQYRLLEATRDVTLCMRALTDLAWGYAEEGDWAQADRHFDALQALAQESINTLHRIKAERSRIYINVVHFRGDYGDSIQRLQGLLARLDQSPEAADSNAGVDLRHELLVALIVANIRYGDYAAAMRYSEQRLALLKQLSHRQLRVRGLLDLALAEQFAGIYDLAEQHNREALALAERTGAHNDAGLLKANLCLTLHQSGQLDAALSFGQQAIQMLRSMGLARMEGQTRNRVGHTFIKLARWSEARAAYEAAYALLRGLKHPNQYESLAGLALSNQQLGQSEAALRCARQVLEFVERDGLAGVVEPALMMLHCAEVLEAQGQAEALQSAVRSALVWLESTAERISDEQVRAEFTEQRTDVVALKTLGATLGLL